MMPFLKCKEWIEKSDWRVLLVLGIVIIFIVALIRDVVIERSIDKKHQEIMAVIDQEEAAIQQAKTNAEHGDKAVNAAFNHATQSVREVIAKSHETMTAIKQKMK